MNKAHRLAVIPALGISAALAAPALLVPEAKVDDGAKEVVSVTAIEGAKTSEELAASLLSGEGSTIADPNDFTSADSTRKVDSASLPADRPVKYDLRNADRDGDGVPESYVTKVKLQNPFGTCWSFGATAAAETSLLAETGVSVDESKSDALPNGLDLSEKQLCWFSMTPIADGSQKGEGSYLGGATASSDRYESGFISTATSLWSTGIGPIDESADPLLEYHNAENTYQDPVEVKTPDGPRYVLQASPDGDWSLPESMRFGANAEL